MVTKQTSLPLLENLFLSGTGLVLYFLEAKAKPNALAICPAVHDTSAAELY